MNKIISNYKKLIKTKDQLPDGCIFLDQWRAVKLKSDIYSMGYPYFSLANKRKHIIHYDGIEKFSVSPSTESEAGVANSFDKDLYIYAVSKLHVLINKDLPISKKIYFTDKDYFNFCSRFPGGSSRLRLIASLDRLKNTNIVSSCCCDPLRKDFHLIEDWEELRDVRIGLFCVTLPDCLISDIEKNQVFSLENGIFNIKSPIERRIYEIVQSKLWAKRKSWSISVDKMHCKIGSHYSIEQFLVKVEELANNKNILSFRVDISINAASVPILTFTRQKTDKLPS